MLQPLVGNGKFFSCSWQWFTADIAILCCDYFTKSALGPYHVPPARSLPPSCSSAGVVLTAFSENICAQLLSKRGISQATVETTMEGHAQELSEDNSYNSWDALFLILLIHTTECCFMEILGKICPNKYFWWEKKQLSNVMTPFWIRNMLNGNTPERFWLKVR